MARAARRASILTAFYLLTFAATAYAECAWVLWRQSAVLQTTRAPSSARFDPSQILYWETVDAYATRDTCQQALKPEEERRKADIETMKKESKAVPLVALKLVCLPDTVDPRGPKGGQR